MYPTLKPDKNVLVLCWFYKLKTRDLVVFKKDNKAIIKRIQKLDGYRIFVVGDNTKESTDSRHFGWIDQDKIIGKVIMIFDF